MQAKITRGLVEASEKSGPIAEARKRQDAARTRIEDIEAGREKVDGEGPTAKQDAIQVYKELLEKAQADAMAARAAITVGEEASARKAAGKILEDAQHGRGEVQSKPKGNLPVYSTRPVARLRPWPETFAASAA